MAGEEEEFNRLPPKSPAVSRRRYEIHQPQKVQERASTARTATYLRHIQETLSKSEDALQQFQHLHTHMTPEEKARHDFRLQLVQDKTKRLASRLSTLTQQPTSPVMKRKHYQPPFHTLDEYEDEDDLTESDQEEPAPVSHRKELYHPELGPVSRQGKIPTNRSVRGTVGIGTQLVRDVDFE